MANGFKKSTFGKKSFNVQEVQEYRIERTTNVYITSLKINRFLDI